MKIIWKSYLLTSLLDLFLLEKELRAGQILSLWTTLNLKHCFKRLLISFKGEKHLYICRQDQIRIVGRERRRNRIPFLYNSPNINALLYPLQTKLSSMQSTLLLPKAVHQKAVSRYPQNSFLGYLRMHLDKVIPQKRCSLGKLQITQNHRMN